MRARQVGRDDMGVVSQGTARDDHTQYGVQECQQCSEPPSGNSLRCPPEPYPSPTPTTNVAPGNGHLCCPALQRDDIRRLGNPIHQSHPNNTGNHKNYTHSVSQCHSVLRARNTHLRTGSSGSRSLKMYMRAFSMTANSFGLSEAHIMSHVSCGQPPIPTHARGTPHGIEGHDGTYRPQPQTTAQTTVLHRPPSMLQPAMPVRSSRVNGSPHNCEQSSTHTPPLLHTHTHLALIRQVLAHDGLAGVGGVWPSGVKVEERQDAVDVDDGHAGQGTHMGDSGKAGGGGARSNGVVQEKTAPRKV